MGIDLNNHNTGISFEQGVSVTAPSIRYGSSEYIKSQGIQQLGVGGVLQKDKGINLGLDTHKEQGMLFNQELTSSSDSIFYGTEEYRKSKGFDFINDQGLHQTGFPTIDSGIKVEDFSKFYNTGVFQKIDYGIIGKLFAAPETMANGVQYWQQKARLEAIQDLSIFKRWFLPGGFKDLSSNEKNNFSRFVGINPNSWLNDKSAEAYDDVLNRYNEHITEPLNYWTAMVPQIELYMDQAYQQSEMNRTLLNNQITAYYKQQNVKALQEDQYSSALEFINANMYDTQLGQVKEYLNIVNSAILGEEARKERREAQRYEEHKEGLATPREIAQRNAQNNIPAFTWGVQSGFIPGERSATPGFEESYSISKTLDYESKTSSQAQGILIKMAADSTINTFKQGWNFIFKKGE